MRAQADGDTVPSVDDLFAFCRSIRGIPLTTAVRRSVFAVEVDGNALAITPSSSRSARREARESIRSVLERLALTGSYRMSDYKDVSFNASYLLALVQGWRRQRASVRETSATVCFVRKMRAFQTAPSCRFWL
jgi:hypothetical protein